MKLYRSSWLKPTAIITLSLLLPAVFIYYQGIQIVMAYLSNDTTRRLPSAIAYPMKQNSCTSSAPITVVSYNVLYGSAFIEKNANTFRKEYSQTYLPWSVRAPEIKERLISYSADLIGLQETDTDADINAIVSNKDYTLVSYHKGDFQYGDAALLFKTERFDLLDSGQFWLSPTPDLPMAFGFRKLAMLRYVNWAMLSDKQSHFKFLFVNTHFDNKGENKEPSATLFRERIALLAKSLPIIVTGDFNTEGGTERYLRFTGSQENPPLLINAYNLARQPKVAELLQPNKRIDHILAGGPCNISATDWRVDTQGLKNGQAMSDHEPIISQLSFNP
ncbi:MAG: endonuclease/exonuclease/phosphatase family protein [Methylococcaceae bacterium]